MRMALVVAATLFVSGCVTTPSFENLSGVTPKSVIDVIECELITARSRIKALEGWTAVAELSLQVDEEATLTPAFTHTGIVSTSLTRIFDWGLKFDTQAQRIYSETVTFQVRALKQTCDPPPTRVSLNGNLGLIEVVEMAFGSFQPSDAGIGFQGGAQNPGLPPGYITERRARAASKGGAKGIKNEAAFGTSIEFVVIKGIGPTGPTWSLVTFKGPGKLFTGQRTDTHKLTISFAKEGAGGPGSAEQAAKEQNSIISVQGLSSAIKQLRVPSQ